MARKSIWSMLCLALLLALVLGCQQMGKVDQGRVVDFNKDTNTLTMIRDISSDAATPDYSFLPPVTYVLPKDPMESGPEPKAGKRMKLDTKNRQIVIYVPNVQNFATINYTLVEQKENVQANDPLVFDAAEGKARKFPSIDKTRKTISIYSKRQAILTTFSVPDEYFMLPVDTWDNGDEARIYYKEPGKAARYMNITKTDIFKK
ncbi:MAG TPA: DUF4881 domain-containing protein [Syntrophobacteraceae bacterium]|nr:DUF4881 domain-containing protein [Syntrophobacteraceae bacterium]